MKWLIITNDDNSDSQNKLAECLCSFDKKNKLSFCDFTCENINKIVKKCDNFASCFIISKNDSNVSDKIKIDSHGFDRFSFRKDPSN